MAPTPLGIARAALDDLLELAGRKTPFYLATPLRDRTTVALALVGLRAGKDRGKAVTLITRLSTYYVSTAAPTAGRRAG